MDGFISNLNSFFNSSLTGLRAYFLNYSFFDHLLTLFDIAIVAIAIYFALVFIRGTKASKIIYGIFILLLIVLVGRIFDLKTLNWVLKNLATMGLVAIPVVFQPELRRALEKLGRTKLLYRTRFFSSVVAEKTAAEIIKALKVLKVNKVGALIILQRKTGLTEYLESGVAIEAFISSELLLNIFFPNSPLHDGAAIIRGDKIMAASCVLPLSEGREIYTLGTRHRAALGITEVTDAIAIVVSEESGTVSLVLDGKITKDIQFEKLEKELINALKR